MTTGEWIATIQGVILVIASLLLFSVRAGIKGGKWTTDQENRLTALEDRFDEASKSMSKLASFAQGWLEAARLVFVSREVADERHRDLIRRLEDLETHRRMGGNK